MATQPDITSENKASAAKKPAVTVLVPKQQLQTTRPESDRNSLEQLERLAMAARTAMVNL